MTSVWSWECIEGYCQKKAIDPKNESAALSLPACRLLCSDVGALWPKPTGDVTIGSSLAKINVNSIDVIGYKSETLVTDLVRSAGQIFKEEIQVRHITKWPKCYWQCLSRGDTSKIKNRHTK